VGGVSYLLRLWKPAPPGTANQNYADAQVIDTVAEGASAGQLTVVEVDGTLSVVSNKMALTAQAMPSWGDLGGYSEAITRALGKGLLATFNLSSLLNLMHGFASSQSAGLTDRKYYTRFGGANLQVYGEDSAIVGAMSAATEYEFALVLGGYDSNGVPWRTGETAASYLYGAAMYAKGGIYTTWTLIWRYSTDNTTPLYAVIVGYDSVGTCDDYKIADVDLSAVLDTTALSTFDAANGTSLDAITPEVGGAWTEDLSDFDIQGNRANHTGANVRAVAYVDLGIADCMIDSVFNGPATLLGGLSIRYTDVNNRWMMQLSDALNRVSLYEINGGVATERAFAAVAIVAATDYDMRAICYGQTIDCFLDGGNKSSYGLAAFNETVTRHGLYAYRNGARHDNFAIYARTSAVYTAEFGAV